MKLHTHYSAVLCSVNVSAAMHTFLTALSAAFYESGQPVSLARNQPLLRIGEVEQHLYLVKEGVVRAYLQAGHEAHTIRFGYAGNIINSLSSYLQNQPSLLMLTAIRKTVVLRLSREHLDLLKATHMPAYCAFIEAQLAAQIDREIDLLTLQPEARLQRVMQRSPQLFQEVPLRYIASYLRMSPETLSRVRAEMQ